MELKLLRVLTAHQAPKTLSRTGSQAQDSQLHAGSHLQNGVGAGLPTLGEHPRLWVRVRHGTLVLERTNQEEAPENSSGCGRQLLWC